MCNHDKGRLILEERRSNYRFKKYLLISLGLFTFPLFWFLIISTIVHSYNNWSYISSGKDIILLTIVLSVLIAVFFIIFYFYFLKRGMCRVRLQIYEKGLIPYYKPLTFLRKNREYFIPWEKMRIMFTEESDIREGNSYLDKLLNKIAAGHEWRYIFQIKTNYAVMVNKHTFEGDGEKNLKLMRTLKLEAMLNFYTEEELLGSRYRLKIDWN